MEDLKQPEIDREWKAPKLDELDPGFARPAKKIKETTTTIADDKPVWKSRKKARKKIMREHFPHHNGHKTFKTTSHYNNRGQFTSEDITCSCGALITITDALFNKVFKRGKAY